MARLFLLILLVLCSGCALWPGSDVEKLYSYREVGLCNGIYVGESHTPGRKIDNCLGLITTVVSLNISAANQTVTLIEEDLKINTDLETKLTVATKLQHCGVVDRENFSCYGLSRNGGDFQNTAAVDGRRLSSSFVAASVARYTNGWLSIRTLTFCESIWATILYSVLGVVAFVVVAAKSS